MAGKPGDGSSSSGDEGSFADLFGKKKKVKRIERGPRVTPPNPGPPSREEPPPVKAGAPPNAGLHFPDSDEPLFGYTSAVDKNTLRKLKRGKVEFQKSIDLHRLDRASAKNRVIEALKRASMKGFSCVLVIPGKGMHSQDGEPLLRDALPDWLNDSKLAGVVHACAPAQRQAGGRGAAYVLLRPRA
jgi:DNA-nicking Smr family endonuclease